MIIISSSVDFLDVALDATEAAKVLSALGLSKEDVTLVRLCILRGGIDEEALHAKYTEAWDDRCEESGAQYDCFDSDHI